MFAADFGESREGQEVEMKVQIITNLYPLPWAPNQASFNRQQFQHLSEKCPVRITILIPWVERFRHRNVSLKPVTEGNLQLSYRSYFYIPGLARWSYAATMWFSLLLESRRIREFSPDCLLLSWAYPDGVAGTMLAKILGLPTLIKIHGSDINMHLSHASRARQILWAMGRAQQIVSVSQALVTRLTDAGIPAAKSKVIYNGVDKELFQPMHRHRAVAQLQLAADRRILLFVGNLKQEKGCVDLLDAFAAISATIPDVDLYYIGAGSQAELLLARATEQELQSRVILLGSLSHAQLALWMNAANIVSLPSYNEGVPNVLLEAMACGTPVVATAVGGIPEVVPKQAGILVEPGDIAGLTAALVEAFATEWKEEEIVNAVTSFDWETNSRQLYESIAEAALAHRQTFAQ